MFSYNPLPCNVTLSSQEDFFSWHWKKGDFKGKEEREYVGDVIDLA